MANEVAIVGVGIHKFGRFGDKPFEEMGAEAIRMALADAGLEWKDVQSAYMSRGGTSLPNSAGAKVGAVLGRNGIGIADVEAACASGGVALKQGVHAIQSGRFDNCVVFGVDKAPKGYLDPTKTYQPWQVEMGLGTNPSYWAMNCTRYMHDYSLTETQLAKVAFKNHRYSVNNPYAMYQKEFSLEEIMNSRVVCWPIRLLEICSPDEGAAAVVLVPLSKAHKYTSHPIVIAGSAHTVGLYSAEFRAPVTQMSARISNPNASVMAGRKAYAEAGIGPDDVDVAETQDTDVFMELSHYEELGWCKEGEAGRMIDEGQTELGGRIPTNLSGGLIAKGEPVGASHLGQITELAWQLRGQLGPRTVEGAKVALGHVTGSMGHTAVTILKK